MSSAVVVGSTGLVGSHILTSLLNAPSISSVHAYTRRELPNASKSPKLLPLSSTDITAWPALFPRSPVPKVFFSALAMTYAAAGSLAEQRKIDVDLNVALARTAKEAGIDTYVLISTGGANSASYFGYTRIKGELEDRVKELGFRHTVILRPGVIMGQREKSRWPEEVARHVVKAMGWANAGLGKRFASDADVIARAAVVAGLECVEGKRQEGVWVLDPSEIDRLGEGR